MKFSVLNPTGHGQMSIPGPVWMLTFDCPQCPGHQVAIHVSELPPAAPVWHIDLGPPPPDFSWDAVTVTPSIRNATHGRKPCGWHGSITKGEVLF